MLDFEKPIRELEEKIARLKETQKKGPESAGREKTELARLERQLLRMKKTIHKNLTPWQEVQLARHPRRPFFLDYVRLLFTDFYELHGDRSFRDDQAVIGGFAKLDGHKVMLIGQQRGRTVEENIRYNFGMMNPEGYRKAIRLMKLADKFSRPILSFVDTQGAFPGMGAEERGQGEAIARNLLEMSLLGVPVITTVIGEGGSGGALGIAVSNAVLMLENSIYSVISPEGCASILYHDAAKAGEAAGALQITARDLYGFGLIDRIVPEPLGGAHAGYEETARNLKKALLHYLKKFSRMSRKKLARSRYDKFRIMGEFLEKGRIITSKRKVS